MIFINLFHSKEQALSYRFSPNVKIYNHKGIQLLANKQEKYIQSTNVSGDGIELEDWAVFAVSLCGNKRIDISDSFMIERVFQDNNGKPQIDWSLKNLPDLGNELFYLEVNQLLEPSGYADTWYSNVFQITSYDAESTARIDYRDDILDTMLSVQLQIFFWHDGANDTLSTYTEAYTGDTVTQEAVYSKYEVWDTKRIPRVLALKFKELFKLTYVYIDLVRCSPFAVFEIPEPSGTENDTKFSFRLSFKYNDVYDASFVPVVDLNPRIDFEEIQYLGSNKAALYYSAYNFEPQSIEVQHSLDGLNWSPELMLFNQIPTSPLYIDLPYPMNALTYLRVISMFDNIFSNTKTIQVESPLTISGLTATYISSQNRWAINVIYAQSYFEGVNIVISTKKNGDNAIETTEVNDGNVTRNILGIPGDVITVFLKATNNTFQSEIKTITLQL